MATSLFYSVIKNIKPLQILNQKVRHIPALLHKQLKGAQSESDATLSLFPSAPALFLALKLKLSETAPNHQQRNSTYPRPSPQKNPIIN